MKATDPLPRKKHMSLYTHQILFITLTFTIILRPKPRQSLDPEVRSPDLVYRHYICIHELFHPDKILAGRCCQQGTDEETQVQKWGDLAPYLLRGSVGATI